MRRFLAHYRIECALVSLVVLVCLARAFMAWPATPPGSEVMRWNLDTDPWLRLTLVQDWLAGGSWYDHGVHNSNAPEGGIESPWTRPLDLVIAGLAQLVPGELHVRLIKAALLLPALWAGLLATGVLRAARRLLPHPDHALVAFAMLACLPMMWNYFGVANADHHAPLAALFAWGFGSLLGERLRRKDAVIAGLLFGVMLWISPETLLLIGGAYLFLGLHWLITREGLRALFLFSLALALMVTLAVMIERPVSRWFVPIYDSVSVMHVLALSLASAAAGLVMLRPTRVVAVIAAIAAALLLYGIYPDFYRGPMVGLHPYIALEFLPRINEAKPLWKQPNAMRMLAMLWQPALALLVLALLSTRKGLPLLGPRDRMLLTWFTVLLIACVMFQSRWYYYMGPLVALSLSVMVAPLFRPEDASVSGRFPARMLEGEAEGFRIFVRQCAVLFVVLMPFAFLLFEPDSRAKKTSMATWSDYCEALSVAWIRSGGMRETLGTTPRTVLASTNLGTQILYFTPYRIIASNYHREGAGIQYVWESMKLTKPAELQAYLALKKVGVLLLCPDPTAPKDSLLLRIYQGKAPVPAYLHRLEMQSMPSWRGLPKKIYEPMLFGVRK